jgi:hypothetical protein
LFGISPVRPDHPDFITKETKAHLLEISCLKLELKNYNLQYLSKYHILMVSGCDILMQKFSRRARLKAGIIFRRSRL